MAKGNGSTRTSRPSTWREAIDATPSERLDFVLSHISKSGFGDIEPDFQAVLAFYALPDADRDEMLRRLEFTGMVERDSFYGDGAMMSIATPQTRDWMWGQVDTYTWHNDPDDDQGFYIGYKDGTVVDTRDWGERHRFKRTDAVWVAGTGLMGGYYWATNAGKPQMMDYMGYSEWKKGKRV